VADFEFVRVIEERFGPPGPDALRLGYALSLSQRAAGVLSDGTVVRNVLEGTMNFMLRDDDGVVVASGRILDTTTWSTGGTTAAAAAAEEDAVRRLVRILADRTAATILAAVAEGGT
jgi:LPS-assembly lipoprotein